MAASTQTLLIASAALAVGVAGTVLVGALTERGGPAAVEPQAVQRSWSDPVKTQASKASSDDASRQRLSFQPDGSGSAAPASDLRARSDVQMPLPPSRPGSLLAAVPVQPEQASDAGKPSVPMRRPVVRERIAETLRGEIRTSRGFAGDRAAERPVREPKAHLSSAENTGVMRWLMEPSRN